MAEAAGAARGLPAPAGVIPALDGVRGLAILAVLAHQLLLDGPVRSQLLVWSIAVLDSGWLGVEIFFVLSGFLITGILLETKSAPNYWSSFFMRRVLRIFPLYYLFLIFTFVALPLLWDLPAAVRAEHEHQLPYWFYVSNWIHFGEDQGVTSLGHCWSLAVEEQFYLVWPLVVYLLAPRALARLCVVFAVGALMLRLGLRLQGTSPIAVYEWTPCRIDALAIGALAAVVVRDAKWAAAVTPHLRLLCRLSAAALVVTALASGILARQNFVTQTIGHSVISISTALWILLAVSQRAGTGGAAVRFLSAPLLRLFGRHSYAIYIIHLPLHIWVTQELIAEQLVGTSDLAYVVWQVFYYLAGTACLLGFAMIIYYLIERPFLSLKRFFAPARRESVTDSPTSARPPAC